MGKRGEKIRDIISVSIVVVVFLYYFGGVVLDTDIFQDLFLKKEGQVWRDYSFEYACKNYTVTISLYKSYYDYFTSKPKLYPTGDTDQEIYSEYYPDFLESKKDREAIKALIQAVQNAIGSYSQDATLLAIISLVQNMEYDCVKFNSYTFSGSMSTYETQFPYETLYRKKGVCEDSSLLLAKVVQELGYGSALFLFMDENHMGLGIACDTLYDDYDSGYCYIETTVPSRLGVVPTIANEMEITSKPVVVPVADGGKFGKMAQLREEQNKLQNLYGDDILYLTRCDDIALFKQMAKDEKILDDFNISMQGYRDDYNDCSVELDYYAKIIDSYEDTLSDLKPSIMYYDSLLFTYRSYGCDAEYVDSDYQYYICLQQYDRLESARKSYNSQVYSYNLAYDKYDDIFDEYDDAYDDCEEKRQDLNSQISKYNTLIDAYNLKVDDFNDRLSELYSSCSPVFVKLPEAMPISVASNITAVEIPKPLPLSAG